jgi:nucleoside-diphosphate-sugar epimerase
MSHLDGVIPDDHILRGDIEGSRMFWALNKVKPEIVFHLAAEPYIPLSYAYPERFMRTNYAGTLNVLMACRTFEVKRVIHYSSSEIYGTAQFKAEATDPEVWDGNMKEGTTLPMTEGHPTYPQSTYAVSKLAADNLCRVLWKEHEIPVTVVRPFNCYGPRETHPYIIPDVIAQFTKHGEAHVGNLDSRRDFTYVSDHARAVALLAEKDGQEGEVFNIGTGKAWSMREVVDSLNKIILNGAGKVTISQSRFRPFEVDELICDSQKLRNLTGWSPEVGFQEGLQRTVDWYKEHKEWSWERHYWM